MARYGIRCNQNHVGRVHVNLVEGETLQALAAKAGDMDRETYKTIIMSAKQRACLLPARKLARSWPEQLTKSLKHWAITGAIWA